MSSHHFVKEGQEPALVIVGKPGFEVVAGLLEWAPLVLVCEEAIDTVLTWGIKIDLVIVEEEKVEYWKNQLISQAPVSVLSSQGAQLDLAFQYLIAKRQQTVSIATDQVASILGLTAPFHDRIDCMVYSDHWKWIYVKNGRYKKWLAKSTILSLTHRKSNVTLSNLLIADDQLLVEEDGFASIDAGEPFWLAEKI